MIKLFRGWIFDFAISWIAAKLREDKALVYALGQYQSGASFLSIIRGYAANTENKEDDAVVAGLDEIEAELKTRPFKDFTARYFGKVAVPDLDGDPSNDMMLQEFIDRVLEKVTNE